MAFSFAVALAGCSSQAAPDESVAETTADVAAEEDAAATPAAALPPDAWQPDEKRKSLPSSRIYYTLTDYDWYERGEPLMHEGRPYMPVGLPIAASAEDMEKVGEYEGVEYYTRRDDSEPIVYVPVFEGYWLGFRPSTMRSANVAKSGSQ